MIAVFGIQLGDLKACLVTRNGEAVGAPPRPPLIVFVSPLETRVAL